MTVPAEEDCRAWKGVNIFWVTDNGSNGHPHLIVNLVGLLTTW
jgi:hypothetical protein